MHFSPTHAMILAAGLGTRMRPLTDHTPKPLIRVGGKTLLDYAIAHVEAAGIANLVVNTHYLADQIEAHLEALGRAHVTVSHEPERLETGGGISRALPWLGEQPFLAMNSDTICLPNHLPVVSQLTQAWQDDMDVCLLLQPRERTVGYDGNGDFHIDASYQRFRRRAAEEPAEMVFTGVQLIHPRVFEGCPHGAFSMNWIYDKRRTADGWFEKIGFAVHDGDWLHVGDPEALKQAERFLSQRAAQAG